MNTLLHTSGRLAGGIHTVIHTSGRLAGGTFTTFTHLGRLARGYTTIYTPREASRRDTYHIPGRIHPGTPTMVGRAYTPWYTHHGREEGIYTQVHPPPYLPGYMPPSHLKPSKQGGI